MEIGRSTGDNVGDGFSITDDSLVALADGSKKKIKDVKEGDYVKSLDEKSGKIVSRKVNALLDHGIKPTFEMETEDGRSINTTAEHPYLVKLYDKESCNKYADTFWNKIDKKENEDLNKFDENGYCTRWVEVSELKEGMEIAVPALQNKPFDFKNSTSSSVVNTLTKDCFLKCGSLDQIGHLSIDNDKARYSVSSISSINEPALSMNFSNFDLLTTLMVPSNLSTRKSISFTGKDEINSILGLCFLNSSNKNSGANKSSLSENNRLFVTPLPINPVNSILASTSSSMNGAIYFNPGYSFLYLSCNPLLTALPNSSAPFSVILDLATIELNSLYSAAFSDIAFRAISDQFNSGMASISSFNSLGIAKVNVGIFNPPLAFNTSNYVYNVQIYKPFGYDTSGFSDRAGIGEKEGNNGDLEGQLFYVDLEKIDSQENQENKKSLKQAETVFAESFNNNNKYLNICDADTENIEKCKGSEMRVSSYELAHMSQAQWIERLSHSREDAGSNFINAPEDGQAYKSFEDNKKEEKTEFHNQVLQTESAALTELNNIKTYVYKNFSVLRDDLSKAGVAQSGTAADSDSAALTGLMVRNLGLESKSEVPSSRAQSTSGYDDIIFERIKSITPLPSQHVYDLSIEGTRNFIANNIIAHNTAVLPYVNTSGLKLLYHLNNESAFQENTTRVYDFAKDVNSELDNHTNGTIYGSLPCGSSSNGKFLGGCLSDNSNKFISFGKPAYVQNFTVMAWIRPVIDNANQYHSILSDYNAAATRANFDLDIWRSGIGADGNKAYIQFTDNAGSTVTLTDGASPLEDGLWYFISATFNGSSPKIYRDGFMTNNVTTALIPSNQGGNWTIGRLGDYAAGNFFFGAIDEVSLWNRSLSADEISNLYKRGAIQLNLSVRSCSDVTCSGNVAYMNFTNNVTSGGTIKLNLSANRFFQYNLSYSRNATGLNATVIINNVTIRTNNTNILTDSFGNYNYTFTASLITGNYLVKENTTYSGTIPGESLQPIRVVSLPAINTNYTVPTYPRFNQNTTLVVNVTDQDNTIAYVNFTLIAPNGTKFNATNVSRVGNLHNVSFNLTSYGTWYWNVSVYDTDGFIINT